MSKFYRTAELKSYYQEAFEEVKNSSVNFWKLDDGIEQYLEVINRNSRLQSIYSKKGKYLSDFSLESYIALAYTPVMELVLLREVIPRFIENYNILNESICNYRYSEPYTREGINDKKVA